MKVLLLCTSSTLSGISFENYNSLTLSLSQTTNFIDSSKCKVLADDNFKFDEFFKRIKKTLWEEEKLLSMSNFSFSHSVFKKDLYCRHVKTRACLGKDQGPMPSLFD